MASDRTKDRVEKRMAELDVTPLDAGASLADRIYLQLRQAIADWDIGGDNPDLRLDERQLSQRLNISRTPLREAFVRLEQEGLVRVVPRKGIFIVRKTKAEILEIIRIWAALESMSARLATEHASDEEIASLRRMFKDYEPEQVGERPASPYHLDEYSERNILFHQRIIELSGSPLIMEMVGKLFIHMRAIRARTISDKDRAQRSIEDHLHIIEALEARDGDAAERLVREHGLNLAVHVENHVDYLE